MTAWVDHLPGPAWAFYLILGIGVSVAGSAIQWVEGAYRAGAFIPLHVWTLGNFAYLLALMHYLDRVAASGIASFRPLLAPGGKGGRPSSQDEGTFARVSYKLTTLPPRQTLIATIAGAAFAIVAGIFQTSAGVVPSYPVGTTGTTISNASFMALLILQTAISGLLVYHTIHQLVLISRIYTVHARISIYQLQPLYALSIPGALTAIGIIVYIYLWFATTASASAVVGPIEIGLALSFAAIAGATFVWPLVGAHRRLVAEKKRLQAEASSRFEAAIKRFHSQLDGRGIRRMDDPTKALAGIEIEQNALRRIPTWPWEPGAARGLAASLLLPVAVWALQLFLGRFLGA